MCIWYSVTVSSNSLAAIAVSTQSTINNIQNTATNTSPSIKTLLLITSSATLTTTSSTNFSSSSCNPQYLRLMQNSSYHRRHSVSGIVPRIKKKTNQNKQQHEIKIKPYTRTQTYCHSKVIKR
jgi:anaerobic C4-dicarboxylate transporter